MNSIFRSVFLVTLCFSTQAAKAVTVAAAASLQDALDDIQNTSGKIPAVKITYGASGALKQQIVQGAPIDVFLSAAEKPVSDLIAQGLTSETRPFLANHLVLIGPKAGRVTSVETLKHPDVKRIAIGEPRSVPAGDYAMQFLESQKLSEALKSRFVYAKDVRQVLTYVQRGEVDAGFVYESDLHEVQDVRMISRAPTGSHKPIVYVAAIIKSSKNPKAAREFLDQITSKDAMTIWKKYGFDTSVTKSHGAH